MDKKKREEMLTAMVAYQKECEAGYHTTPRALAALACPGAEADETDLLALSVKLNRRAQKEGLLLDCDCCNGEEVGLPQNIGFSLYFKKPGRRCPFCGSYDTAGICYGYPGPGADAFFVNEQREHRFFAGGCEPRDFREHCFHCEKEFR